jgi:hypothetical protein
LASGATGFRSKLWTTDVAVDNWTSEVTTGEAEATPRAEMTTGKLKRHQAAEVRLRQHWMAKATTGVAGAT